MEACRVAGTPKPSLRYERTGLWIEFAFPENRIANARQSDDTTQETTQEQILALLRSQPALTRRELATRVGISQDGIKYHLERMKSAGVIRHVGATKAGRWEVLN